MKKLLVLAAIAMASLVGAQTSTSGTANVTVTVQDYASVTFQSGGFTLNVTDPTVASQSTNSRTVTVQSNRNYTISAPTFTMTGGLSGTPNFSAALSGVKGSSTGTLSITVTGISITTNPNTSGYTGTCTVTIQQV